MQHNFNTIFFRVICFILFFNITTVVYAQDSIPPTPVVKPVTSPSAVGEDPAPNVVNPATQNNANPSTEPTSIVPNINPIPKKTFVEKPDLELLAAMENNPFALIHDGKRKKSTTQKDVLPVSSKSKDSKKKSKKEDKVKEDKVEEVVEVFVSVDTATAALDRQNPFRLEGTPDERKAGAATKKIKFNPEAGSGAKSTTSNTFAPIFDTSKVNVNQLGTLKFVLVTFLFGFLAIIMTRFRSEVNDVYKAFLNQILMSLLHREKGTILRLPYVLLYALSAFSVGTMIFLSTRIMGVKIFENNYASAMICILGASTIFLGRHTLLWLLAYIFPFSKEAKLYSFSIAIFNFIIGIALLPFIIFIAFAADNTHTILLYAALFSISILYIFRIIRSLLITNKYLIHNKFHFFMYLCTVEIAPILILLKLVGL